MDLRTIFSPDIMADHKLVAVLAHFLTEATPTPRTVKISGDYIDLKPYELIVKIETTQSMLKLGENELLDMLRTLEGLRRIKHTILNGCARIELLSIQFPIGPTRESTDPLSGLLAVNLSRWIEIEKQNWPFSAKYLEMTLIALEGLKKAVGDVPLTTYTPYHCSNWMTWLQQRTTNKGTPVKNSSVNNYLRALKASFRRAIPVYIKVDVFKQVKYLRQSNRRNRVPEPDECSAILESLEKPWMRDTIEFAFLTGLRRSEVVNLLTENVDLERKMIHIRKNEFFHPKFNEERDVEINQEALRIISRSEDRKRNEGFDSPLVFVDEKGLRILPGRFTKLFTRQVKMTCENQDLRLHDARRAFATKLESNGVSTRIIGHLLGHKSLRTTEKYLGICHDQVSKAIESISMQDFTRAADEVVATKK